MLELSEAPQLSQRAVYADVRQYLPLAQTLSHPSQIFGFKNTMSHTVIQLDPNEQTNLRYRLFARALRINGVSQLENLSPYLQARLEETIAQKVDPQLRAEGLKLPDRRPTPIYSYHRMEFSPNSSNYARFCYGDDGSVLFWGDTVFVHSLITNKGKALDVLFERLHRAVDPIKPDWNESKTLRPVISKLPRLVF
ncbi:MAG: hypothetical protein Q9192_002415 [Flavoplaca navasiana]